MAPITTFHYLVTAAALLVLGVIGVLTRRNVVIVLMSIELILNAVNLNLVAFSRLWGLHGQVFAIFVITDAAAEAAVGLGAAGAVVVVALARTVVGGGVGATALGVGATARGKLDCTPPPAPAAERAMPKARTLTTAPPSPARRLRRSGMVVAAPCRPGRLERLVPKARTAA